MAEVTLQEAAQGALVEKKGNFKPGHPKFGGRQEGAAGLASRDVSAPAAKYTARCLRELWALAKATADDKVKAQCLIELLERGHGKVPSRFATAAPVQASLRPAPQPASDDGDLARRLVLALGRSAPAP